MCYPNAMLATKPTSNLQISPDMWDTVELSVDLRTPMDTPESFQRAREKVIKSHLNAPF